MGGTTIGIPNDSIPGKSASIFNGFDPKRHLPYSWLKIRCCKTNVMFGCGYFAVQPANNRDGYFDWSDLLFKYGWRTDAKT